MDYNFNSHTNTFPVRTSLLHISEENILRGLGVPVDKADHYLMDRIRNLISESLGLASPHACWSIFPDPQFLANPGRMILEGKTFHLDKMVTFALAKSSAVVLFAGTCGEKVEQYSRQLMKDSCSLEALIVDLIGSEIAEGVADFIHKRIAEEVAANGFKVTNRYSPGYCNWPVSDQQQLFQLLGEENCGIRLTGSSLMVPVKSVSGIIGTGTQVENKGYSCAICDAGHCLYRDKRR